MIAPSGGAGAGNEIMGVKEGQTSSLNFDNGLLAEKTERPPAPIPKTKLTAKNRSEFADLISQYADYTNMVSSLDTRLCTFNVALDCHELWSANFGR